jgi:UDP-N-acetylglucosamine 2-epimerase (non-hydrolysing)
LLFTPSTDGNENLIREGIDNKKIHFVGNVMIDTLVSMLPTSRKIAASQSLPPRFALLTLHRPSNVDDPNWLAEMLASLGNINTELVILFPVHPRTREKMKELKQRPFSSVRIMDPQPYLTFLALEELATVVVTDSGGIQEETTYLGVPCLTVRENTERPVTVEMGTNILVGRDPKRVQREIENILDGGRKVGKIPPLWDGHAGTRIAAIISKLTVKHA